MPADGAVEVRAFSHENSCTSVPPSIRSLVPRPLVMDSGRVVRRFSQLYWLLACNFVCDSLVTDSARNDLVGPIRDLSSSWPSLAAVSGDDWIQMLTALHSVSCLFYWWPVRLATFEHWPLASTGPSPLALSLAGFCYLGHGTEATCFSCGLALRLWKVGVHPLAAHLENSGGQCKFLRGILPNSLWGVGQSVLQSSSTQTLLDSRKGQQQLVQQRPEQRLQPPPCSEQQWQQARSWNEARQFKSESDRLNSYVNRWNHSSTVDPRDLARSGFFYTGEDDRVECAFCCRTFSNWQPGDIVDERHAQQLPKCRFVQGLDDVGNVPMPFLSLPSPPFNRPCNAITSPDSAIAEAVPARLYFAYESRRMASFTKSSMNGRYCLDSLVKSGFFFTGTQDFIRCFYCGLSVEDLSQGSDSLDKHARSCQFVKQLKGLVPKPVTDDSSGSTRVACRAVDPREVRARMDTPIVRAVLEMGHPRPVVAEVIQNKLAVGFDYETPEDLLAGVFAYSDENATTAAPVAAAMNTYESGFR